MGKLKKRWPVIVAAIVVAELLGLGADEETNGETTISDAVATVEEASQHTAALDNGKYTYRLQTTGQETSEQWGEGIFSKTETGLDWHTYLFIAQEDADNGTLTEEIQTEGVLYQRVGTVDENKQFVETESHPDWQVVSKESELLPRYTDDLLTVDLEEDDIKAVEIRQEEGQTVYTFLYTEEYLTSVSEANVEALNRQIEALTEENAAGSYFSALEQAVKMQQNTRFKEAKTSMTVDESGLLTQVRSEHTVEQTLDGTLHTGKTLRETTLVEDNSSTIEIEDPSN